MSDHGGEREYSHEYVLIARPSLRVRFAVDTRAGSLEACSVAFDYDEYGVDDPIGTTERVRPGIEWRGSEIEVYRNGERVLADGLDVDTSEVLGYVDEVARLVSRLSRRVR